MKLQFLNPFLLGLAFLTACPGASNTPSFDITLNPATLSAKPGDTTAKINFTIARQNGFAADVITSISNNTIVGAANNQIKVNTAMTSKDSGTLEFMIGVNVPLQTYTLEFQAVAGDLKHTVNVSLDVKSGVTQPNMKQGVVTILEFQTSSLNLRSASAVFYEHLVTEPPVIGGNGIAPDNCLAIAQGETEPTQPASVKTLDAGTEIAIKQSSGIYVNLLKTFLQGKTSYGNDPRKPLGEVPNGLTVSIPGSAKGFPAFANVPMPDFPADFTVLAPVLGTPLALDGTITWEGGLDETHQMGILINSSAANSPSAICFVKDDGSFGVPINVKTVFETAGISKAQVFSMQRFASRSETANGVNLLLNTIRGKIGF
jgi:hypothetical protein